VANSPHLKLRIADKVAANVLIQGGTAVVLLGTPDQLLLAGSTIITMLNLLNIIKGNWSGRIDNLHQHSMNADAPLQLENRPRGLYPNSLVLAGPTE
jgi:hypothetical protein